MADKNEDQDKTRKLSKAEMEKIRKEMADKQPKDKPTENP